eukprot:88286-Chlamydomonas_euryale.AAC.3
MNWAAKTNARPTHNQCKADQGPHKATARPPQGQRKAHAVAADAATEPHQPRHRPQQTLTRRQYTFSTMETVYEGVDSVDCQPSALASVGTIDVRMACSPPAKVHTSLNVHTGLSRDDGRAHGMEPAFERPH